MIEVRCVLNTLAGGGREGVYTALWVERLRAQVAANLAQPHRFVCYSDVEVLGIREALRHSWPGWWAKMELFRRRGPALYLDLDTIVLGPLDDLAAQALSGGFTMLRDFYRGDGLGSGLMAWDGEVAVERLYRAFADDAAGAIERTHGGDQVFLETATEAAGFAVQRWQDVLPGQVVSYKAQHCEAGPPPSARVLCFHGHPKQSDLPRGHWAREIWEAAA